MNIFKASDARVLPVHMATRYGVNETLFLRQLYFYVYDAMHFGFERDGRRWVKFTLSEWHEQFPFWSERTLRAVIKRCETEGWIDSIKAEPGWNQAKAYTLDRAHPMWQILPHADDQTGGSHVADSADCHVADSAGCTNDKTTEKTTGSTQSVDEVAEAFTSDYSREDEIAKAEANPTHGPTLAKFWQRAMRHYEHTLQTQPSMTKVSQKHLKDLFDRLPDPGVQILNVVGSYGLFVNYVQDGKGFPTLPAKPTPAVLVKYIEYVAEFEPPEWVEDEETDYESLGVNLDEALADKG